MSLFRLELGFAELERIGGSVRPREALVATSTSRDLVLLSSTFEAENRSSWGPGGVPLRRTRRRAASDALLVQPGGHEPPAIVGRCSAPKSLT